MSAVQVIKHIRALGPDGTVVKNGCNTKIEIYEANYLWVIHDYSYHKAKLTKGKSLKSPIFFATADDGFKWYLKLYPNGRINRENNNSSLFVHLNSMGERIEVFGKLKFSIFDENQKKYVNNRASSLIRKLSLPDGCGYESFIKNNYLASNDKLIIYCEINFSFADPVSIRLPNFNSIKRQSKVPKVCLREKVNKLFRNEKFTDVVISANGKEFKAHKFILMAHSPVFAAMFKHESTKENLHNKVEISDFNEQVVEEMLNYIYTDESVNLERLADGLLAAAEKYDIDGLKELSEDALIEKLSIENAIDTLILADFHSAHKLKSSTIDYIVAKSAKVMKTTAWKNFSSTHSHLILEVCNAVTDKLHRGAMAPLKKKWGISEFFSGIW